jgi:nucleoid-associated protein EbfC
MNIQAMMKQAQQMQERLKKQIKIDPEVVSKDDVEMLQDLILAAINDAHRKVDEQLGQQMQGLMGGLKIPGL